ncbi:tetratricopeptide repeat protein [Candidatus Venteria ishoeyi]|uniref:Localization factor PodJL n=1 Tax=Candidatus Venteria ishoeyi TaxID=1899563 RepID=A0A1H6FH65_9GAMM|nr:tetratricopeptide repeat protein [Candidatus Venteria ishoeyi]SEH08699.1 Localization factor PodJL [Candidatus Venteria ishoeyi]
MTSEDKISLDNLGGKKYQAVIATLKQAAQQGHPEAQYRLALLYSRKNEQLPLDYAQAAKWFQKAAEQQHAEAQSRMGWLCANGLGLKQNDEQAGKWYLKAAKQGLAKDQYLAGSMYQRGLYGVSKNLEKMLYWYQLSANQHFAPAQFILGKLLAEGTEIPQDQALAFQWLSLAAAHGSENGEALLAQLMQQAGAEQISRWKQAMMR